MSKARLNPSLGRILKESKETEDILDAKEMVDALLDLLTAEGSADLTDFGMYLEEECGLPPRVVLAVAEGLCDDAVARECLGKKAVALWLQFKVYEAMDILRNLKESDQNHQKRKRVAAVLRDFGFSGSDPITLLKACCRAVGESEEDAEEMGKMVAEGREALVGELFAAEAQPIAYNPDKSIGEQLNDLLADYESLPEGSFEKALQRELIVAHVLKHREGERILRQRTKLELTPEISALRENYRNEFGGVTTEVQTLLRKAEADDPYDALCALKKKANAIDVLELERLIGKTRKASELIKGKDVLLMVGNTGSGKSTNILKLLGYDLKTGKFGKLTTLVPTSDLDEAHRSFFTSPEAKSCTRYINAVPIPPKMYPKATQSFRMNLFICDTPGFGDSAGVEVDIANGVGMINALHGAKTARVVVILPYDSLTGDRMAGAIKMSEIIANLFTDLTIIDSIAILFNKVPKDKIEGLPDLIQNKLLNITQVEKSNDKLLLFLKEMGERAKNPLNFIDPLKSDFTSVFKRLFLMTPISNLNEYFQYQFTNATKQEISRYAQSQKDKVEASLKAKNFIQAEFYLNLLKKLTKIITNDEAMKNVYVKLTQHVQQTSRKEFSGYQDLITDILSSRTEVEKLQEAIEVSKNRIHQIQRLFGPYEDIQVVESKCIDEIITENKKRLLDTFNGQNQISSKTIQAAKVFSTLFDKKFQGSVVNVLKQRFQSLFSEVGKLLDKNRYVDLIEKLPHLTRLVECSSQFSKTQTITRQFKQFKSRLSNQVEQCLKSISDKVITQVRISDYQINDVNRHISHIKNIQALDFLENYGAINDKLVSLLKNIQSKCIKNIRDLSNLRLSLNQDMDGKISIQKDELKTKKKEIQLLMKIDNIGKNLQPEYKEIKESISMRLDDNVEILKNCILDLRNNRNEEFFKSLENIKKATIAVVQCSQIVDEQEGQNMKIAQSIEIEFNTYLNGEIMALRSIEFKLSHISPQTLLKITSLYNKVDSYSKMSVCGSSIQTTVNQLRNQLHLKLKAPFTQFLDKNISQMKDNSYRFFNFIIQKLQKFSYYALGIYDIVSQEEYGKISESEGKIITTLTRVVEEMKRNTEEFTSPEFDHKKSIPIYLKDLIKTLLSLDMKTFTCDYLNHKVGFEVSDKLRAIEIKLQDIRGEISPIVQDPLLNLPELQQLGKKCKCYGDIEDVYRINGESVNKFGFQELLRRCVEESSKRLKSDEDRIKNIIEGYKPSKIDFSQLQVFYNKFQSYEAAQSNRKRRLITQQLRKIEQNTFNQLKSFRYQIDDLKFVKQNGKIDDFLQAFTETVEIEKNLRKLYSHADDKRLIQTKPADIHLYAQKVIEVFQRQLENTTHMLKTYNLTNINENMKAIRLLEDLIYRVFPIDESNAVKQEEGQTINGFPEGKNRIQSFITKYTATLKEFINTQDYGKREGLNLQSIKKLNKLLQIIKRGVQQQVQGKYEGEGIQIDEKFQVYFSHSNEQKKKQLTYDVEAYMEDLHKQYRDNFNNSLENAERIKNTIQESLKLLPFELKRSQAKAFEGLKLSLNKQNQELLSKVFKTIMLNPKDIGSLFESSGMALRSGQNDFHLKWIIVLEDTYNEYEKKMQTVEQRISFIAVAFTELYENSKYYLDTDAKMLEALKKKYIFSLKKLITIGQNGIAFVTNLLNDKVNKDAQYKEAITDIFKIIKFFIFLRDDEGKIIDHAEYRNKLLESYNSKLNTIVGRYNQILSSKPESRLNSNNILQQGNANQMQGYMDLVKISGCIIKQIGLELKDIQGRLDDFEVSFLQSIHGVRPYQEVLSSFRQQFQDIFNFIKDFQFFSDIKRNYNPKQIEEDLNKLNRYCQILLTREKFFKSNLVDNAYDFKSICNDLQEKFNMYFYEGNEQVTETFRRIDGEPAEKINLLLKQLSIMVIKERQTKFIAATKTREFSKVLKKKIQSQFETAQIKCQKALDEAKIKYNQYSREYKKIQTKRQEDIQNEDKKYDEQLKTQSRPIKEKFLDKIKYETEEKLKLAHKNALIVEESSITNQLKLKRKQKITQNEEEYKQEVASRQKDLEFPVGNFANQLIIFQKALLDILEDSQQYKKYLENILENMVKIGPKFIKFVQKYLFENKTDYRSIGKVILTNYKAFGGFKVTLINKMIQGQKIDYVIDHLKAITINGREKMPEKELKTIDQLYQKFKLQYDEHKNRYSKAPLQTTIEYMLTNLKDLAAHLKKNAYQNDKPSKEAELKIQLLAGIFALWAILKSEVSEGEVEFTIEPHPTQITTLILLLGISHHDEKMQNRLAQVGTGEGKSIVLAGLSSYLALVGFKVRCACYSAYLSSRDQDSFKVLFRKLGVENEIKYGTFNQLCEDILNGNGKDLKKQVEDMLLKPPSLLEKIGNVLTLNRFNFTSLARGKNQIAQNPTVLVIDEVDVFFDDSFFGNIYCPAINLRGNQVKDFLKYVWQNVKKYKQATDGSKLTNSKQFEKLVEKYPTLKKMLKNQVNGMITGALNYEHNYFIKDKCIFYKDGDSISSKINYGYKTVFAYLHEYQNNKVDKVNLDEALQISLMIAEFSYASLPNFFKYILGVTGTLQVLPKYKKRQLQERYDIKDQYAIPSAFGINKRRTEEYAIAPTAAFQDKIIEKINNVRDKRPIIVFFKGPKELNDFFTNPKYESLRGRTSNLTEQHEQSTRDARIVGAVVAGKITLMSSAFGRGTDFLLLDEDIKKNGGLHIIQVFLSVDESEEVQIKGRTARQDSNGSYDCVIDENSLEELTLTPASFPQGISSQEIHKILLRAREERMARLSDITMKNLQVADSKHQKVLNIFAKQKLGQQDLIQYVSELNEYPGAGSGNVTIKTVMGIDGTGSMSAGLAQTCQIISTAFTRTYQVLDEKKVKANIEVKIMVYRNYDSPFQDIIESTPFENTATNLQRFLSGVTVKGGWGNEALQVLFQSLNKEANIDQVFLIGDAAPNTEGDVKSKRKSKGEKYWQDNGIPLTHIQKELDIFKEKKCPVHSYYLKADGNGFIDISASTGGIASQFNLESRTVTDEFTSFVVERILALIEKNSGKEGLQLVDSYRKMFSK